MEDYKLRDLRASHTLNGRLQTKRSTRLSHTGLVVELEDLKIKTVNKREVCECEG
jgi:hypothetical protein